jgi:hypothetical protein
VQNGEAAALGERAAQAGREREIGAGKGAVNSGWVLAFYRDRGSTGEGWPRRLTPALMALTPLKTGRLDERLRSAIKEEN